MVEANNITTYVAAMRRPDGLPLMIFGSVSTHLVLPLGTVAEVEAAVDRCVEIARGRGGVLIAPSSSIGPEVPPENIAAMYRRVREWNAEVEQSGAALGQG